MSKKEELALYNSNQLYNNVFYYNRESIGNFLYLQLNIILFNPFIFISNTYPHLMVISFAGIKTPINDENYPL